MIKIELTAEQIRMILNALAVAGDNMDLRKDDEDLADLGIIIFNQANKQEKLF